MDHHERRSNLAQNWDKLGNMIWHEAAFGKACEPEEGQIQDRGYHFQKIRRQVHAMEEVYGFTNKESQDEFKEELLVLAAMVAAACIDLGLPDMNKMADRTEKNREPLWKRSWRSSNQPLPLVLNNTATSQ